MSYDLYKSELKQAVNFAGLNSQYTQALTVVQTGTASDVNKWKRPLDGVRLSHTTPKPVEQFKALCERAVFEFHLNKIKTLVNAEIRTIRRQDRQGVQSAFAHDMEYLANHFRRKVSIEPGESIDPEQMERIVDNFRKDAQAVLDKYSPWLEHQKSWSPFVKNLLLCLAVVGIYSMVVKASTGRYAFFDDKRIDLPLINAPLPSMSETNPAANL